MALRTKAPSKTIDELMRDGRAITAAAKRAVRRAVAELDRDPTPAPASKNKKKAKPRPAASSRAKPVARAAVTAAKPRPATKRRAA